MSNLDHIAEPLRPFAVPVDSLTPDPANARKHGERNLETIRASLVKFGFRQPIVVQKQGMIVRAGNARLHIAKVLGWTHIPALIVDEADVEATAYAIADNRTSELAEWDQNVLASLLESLPDANDAGWNDAELKELLDQLERDSRAEIVEDEVPEPPAVPITQPGDLWLLGEHRVLCGDSTNAEDVGRVMRGDKSSLVFTDPPYGMSFQSNMRTATPKFDVIENDDTILTDWIPNAIRHSDGWVFVWTTWKVLAPWLSAVRPFGALSNLVVWHKGGGGIGDLTHTFATDHELALVFSRGATICGKRIGSVWSFTKDAAATYLHPTQKPVALAAEAIEKTTNNGATVLDLFLGSGTTLIAAEQLNRRCFGIEIDPAYCDVIVQRWEKLTGKTATRETSD